MIGHAGERGLAAHRGLLPRVRVDFEDRGELLTHGDLMVGVSAYGGNLLRSKILLRSGRDGDDGRTCFVGEVEGRVFGGEVTGTRKPAGGGNEAVAERGFVKGRRLVGTAAFDGGKFADHSGCFEFHEGVGGIGGVPQGLGCAAQCQQHLVTGEGSGRALDGLGPGDFELNRNNYAPIRSHEDVDGFLESCGERQAADEL